MKTRLLTIAILLILATLAVAQNVEQPPPADTRVDGLKPGEAALRALALPPLQLGADLGNACICLCRQASPPEAEYWAYFERSIVSGCQWSGRICVVEDSLGRLGACVAAPAPLD